MNNLTNLKFPQMNQTLYFYTNFYQLPRISPRQDFGSWVGRALGAQQEVAGSMLSKIKKQECKHTFHYDTIHGEWFLV